LGDGAGDVEVIPTMRHLEPEMFGEVFHGDGILTTAASSTPIIAERETY
jgi:hypothetical protein